MFGFLAPKTQALIFSAAIIVLLVWFLWEHYPGEKYRKTRRLVLIFGFVFAVAFSMVVPPLLSSPKIDNEKVVLCLGDAYELDHYKGSANERGNRVKCITEPIKLKFSKKEWRMHFIVRNNNMTIPIDGVNLWIYFPEKKGLKVRPDGSWSERYINEEYHFKLGNITNGDGWGADGALFVTFPSPGDYQIDYGISAREMKPIHGDFKIILKE